MSELHEFALLAKAWRSYLDQYMVPDHPDRFLQGLKVCTEQLEDVLKRAEETTDDE